jgi:hypothetical protein
MARVTSDGLESSTSVASTLTDFRWAAASGTVDVIVAALDPALESLEDGRIVGIRTNGPNVTSSPTLNVDATGAKTIKKNFDVAVEKGDVPDEALFRYNLANDVWVLINPNPQVRVPTIAWGSAGGTVDAITLTLAPALSALGVGQDGMEFGFRAGGANATTTPTLSVDAQTAYGIKKLGAVALAVGDIYGANHECKVRFHYDVATPWFELLNPAGTYAAASGETIKELTVDGGTFADDTNAHGIGLKVTLPIGDHEFRGRLHTTRTAGANSHVTKLLFGGTGTYTIKGQVQSRGGDANALATISGLAIDVATAQTVKAASTSISEDVDLYIRGVVSVTVAGTFEPQLQYDVAPGGVTTPKAGSYLGTKKVTNPTGTWT